MRPDVGIKYVWQQLGNQDNATQNGFLQFRSIGGQFRKHNILCCARISWKKVVFSWWYRCPQKYLNQCWPTTTNPETLTWGQCKILKIPMINNQNIMFKTHDDAMKWKHFPRYWLFVRGINRWPVDSPNKSQWRGALVFSLICAWPNGWANNRGAGGLGRHRAHYDVTVMRCRPMGWGSICRWYLCHSYTSCKALWIITSTHLCPNIIKDIEAETKLPSSYRRQFKMHIPEWKCLNFA